MNFRIQEYVVSSVIPWFFLQLHTALYIHTYICTYTTPWLLNERRRRQFAKEIILNTKTMFLMQKNEKSRGWKYPRFLWHARCRFYCWDKMGKKAYPIYQNPAMTVSTCVKPKVILFMKKRVGRSKQKQHLRPTLKLHIHTLCFSHRCTLIPVYSSKPHLPT